ncbi:MAG: helix-turn-helix transcriptional regulator [Clostridia bacterium]|nr:helix-turn-helix transcriptional regulator [Clostridia bacterium]
MKYTEAVGKRLSELLKEVKFTQKRFSEKTNISRVTINRMINGRVKVVTFETLIIFCETLNITLRDFFASELFDE